MCKMQCALHHNMPSLIMKKEMATPCSSPYVAMQPGCTRACRAPLCLEQLGPAVARTRCLTKACVLLQVGKDAQNQVQAAAARALQVREGPLSTKLVLCIHIAHLGRLL